MRAKYVQQDSNGTVKLSISEGRSMSNSSAVIWRHGNQTRVKTQHYYPPPAADLVKQHSRFTMPLSFRDSKIHKMGTDNLFTSTKPLSSFASLLTGVRPCAVSFKMPPKNVLPAMLFPNEGQSYPRNSLQEHPNFHGIGENFILED